MNENQNFLENNPKMQRKEIALKYNLKYNNFG